MSEPNKQQEINKKLADNQATKIIDGSVKGDIIGKVGQKLSEGHDPESIQKWDKVEFELKLQNIERNGRDVGMPYEAQCLRVLSTGHSGADRSFQEQNKQKDFRLIANPNNHVYFVPAGSMVPGQKYESGTWFETVGRPPQQRSIERLLIKGNERMTGAPVTA